MMAGTLTINNVALPVAIWLKRDDYDYSPDSKVFSATELLKPTKQIVLTRRLRVQGQLANELEDNFFSARGSCIHAAIESAVSQALTEDGMLVGAEELGKVDIKMETRSKRELEGFTISGKFDMLINNHLYDFKNTSLYSYKEDSRKEEYRWQMSIYRWLNPEIIKGDSFTICFILQDWRNANKDEIDSPVPFREYEFYSLEETEQMLRDKIKELKDNLELEEKAITQCKEEELWLTPIVYKYYSSTLSTRASKNFTSALEANAYLKEKGKGVLLKTGGEAMRCKYCEARDICSSQPRTNQMLNMPI